MRCRHVPVLVAGHTRHSSRDRRPRLCVLSGGRVRRRAASRAPCACRLGRRPPASVVALSVCTLGVYALVWHSRVNREMGDFDPRMPVRAGRSTWALAIPVLLFWAAAAAAAMRVVLAQTAGIHANIGLDES